MNRAFETAASISLVSPGETGRGISRLQGRPLLMARIAWLVVAVLVAGLVVATLPGRYEAFLHTARGGLSPGVYATYETALFATAVILFEGVAALLVWHRSGQRMALLSAFALATFPVYSTPPARLAHLPPAWHWTGAVLSLAGIIALTLAFYLVPDGRFAPPWTRWLIAPWVLIQAAHQFLPMTSWDYLTWPALLSIPAVAGGLGPALIVMLYRYRHILTRVQRQQTAWLMWGLVLAIAIVVATEIVVKLLPLSLQENLVVVTVADTARVGAAVLVPVGIALAIVRHRLWAMDLLIHRTLVYGMLTASVIGLYVLVVGTLSTALQGHAGVFISLVATGLVAVLFQPLRERLQQSVNGLLYGVRDDPYRLLSQLGQRLEETLVPEAVFQAMVDTVARALKLPYVAIALPQDGSSVVVAEHGTPVTEPLVLPLVYQHQLVGQLLVAPRAGSDTLSSADRRLFADLIRQASVAVHASELRAKAVRLSSELQQANSQLVTLREEERRRLRRDLHDGLGSTLASVTLHAENARDLLHSDPAQVDAVLADLTVQTQSAIADIRRVVYDLRPPALDDLGLVEAVRVHACGLSREDLAMTVESPEELPSLPAAVEVAAYRIVQESLTNVVRHSRAESCTVSLRLGDSELGEALTVDVIDDGLGLSVAWRPGMGLQSMRARAAELYGICTVDARTGQRSGTHVHAVLPLLYPADAPATVDA